MVGLENLRVVEVETTEIHGPLCWCNGEQSSGGHRHVSETSTAGISTRPATGDDLVAVLAPFGAEIGWCVTHDSAQHGEREHCQAWYLPSMIEDNYDWCEFVRKLMLPLPDKNHNDDTS